MDKDIDQFKSFYQTNMGQIVCNCINYQLSKLWGNVSDQAILGFGYTTPFLGEFLQKSNRLISFTTRGGEVDPWPPNGANCNLIGDESDTPFEDSSFDKILCVHGLEDAQNPRALMREIWRILGPEGQLIIFATNRHSVWAQNEHTPFGNGRPFSKLQATHLLQDGMFEIIAAKKVLALPPLNFALSSSTIVKMEKIGEKFWPALGGLVMIQARKRLFSGIEAPQNARKSRFAIKTATNLASKAHNTPKN